jgi:hypothetical protein
VTDLDLQVRIYPWLIYRIKIDLLKFIIKMLNLYNGQERTERDFTALGEATGWKLESVFRKTNFPSFLYSAIWL